MKQITREMLKIYKPFSNMDWMNYRLVKRDMTFHHIEKKADGGKQLITNGALLMPIAHQYLHLIECKDIRTYEAINHIFRIVNDQKHEPTREQREIVEYLMKYEFIKVDDDNIILKYKDKEFNIKKDIDLLKRLGSIQQKAKIKMMADLKKDGLTVSDLEVERHEGNKTIIDKSNLTNLEKDYLDIVANEILNEITLKYTNMGLLDIFKDMDLTDTESEKFVYDLLFALKGELSPSWKK